MNNFKPRHWCETGWLCNKQSNCRNIYETYPMHQTWCQCRSQFFIYQSWQKWVNWDQIKLPLQLIKANLCRGSIKLDQSSCPDNFVEMSSLLIVRHFCQICHNPTHWTCACQILLKYFSVRHLTKGVHSHENVAKIWTFSIRGKAQPHSIAFGGVFPHYKGVLNTTKHQS